MQILSLYNLKGGVGKTASSVNFAHLAALSGKRVLLWDLDPQGAAGYYFGHVGEHGTAKRLVTGKEDIRDAIVPTPYPGLDLLPADLSARKLDLILHKEGGSEKQLKSVLKGIKKDYDLVFLDCPPLFSLLADNVFFASDVVLMPVIPTTLSVRTYYMVRDYLIQQLGHGNEQDLYSQEDQSGEKKSRSLTLACFFTMADMRKKMHRDVMTQLYEDRRFFEHYIPALSDIEKMGAHSAPLLDFAPASFAAICYRALWEEIAEGL